MFRLRQNLTHALRGCPTPDYVCGCFAGLLTKGDAERAAELLREFYPQAKISTQPDYAAAYFASEPGTDLCVIAGTGSLVCSWDGSQMVKSGGRGYILGDEGSAFQYGRDALLSFLANPMAASDALTKCIVDLFEVEDEPSIVSRLYRSPSPQATVAKLAKPLAADAKNGREYATESIAKNASSLAAIVLKHVRAHMPGKAEIRVSLSGGLWKTSTMFVDGLAGCLADSNIHFDMQRIKTPPVFGAARLAQEMALGH
jgi:N-acetylglucosamine kinase-like BadF-type ATPase